MVDNKPTEQEMQELRNLYLAGAKEEPSDSLSADILALSRHNLDRRQEAPSVNDTSQQRVSAKGPQKKFSPWVWSSAASVLLVLGLSLYWPALQGPSPDGPALQPEPVMMRASEPGSAEANQKMVDNSADQAAGYAAPVSATSAPGDQAKDEAVDRVMTQQSPVAAAEQGLGYDMKAEETIGADMPRSGAAAGVSAKSLPQPSAQNMVTLAVSDDKAELARSLDKLAELIKAGELASASLEFKALAPQVSQLPKEDPVRIRYQQLGEMLNK